jgi:hypothetical protein
MPEWIETPFACGLSLQRRHRGRAEAPTVHNQNIHRQPPIHKTARPELASRQRWVSKAHQNPGRKKTVRISPSACDFLLYISDKLRLTTAAY